MSAHPFILQNCVLGFKIWENFSKLSTSLSSANILETLLKNVLLCDVMQNLTRLVSLEFCILLSFGHLKGNVIIILPFYF